MSNRSNITALPTPALPDPAATTLVATSRKHSHHPVTLANASAPLRSESCISTHFPHSLCQGPAAPPQPQM